MIISRRRTPDKKLNKENAQGKYVDDSNILGTHIRSCGPTRIYPYDHKKKVENTSTMELLPAYEKVQTLLDTYSKIGGFCSHSTLEELESYLPLDTDSTVDDWSTRKSNLKWVVEVEEEVEALVETEENAHRFQNMHQIEEPEEGEKIAGDIDHDHWNFPRDRFP